MNEHFSPNPTKAEKRLAQALRRQQIKFMQNQILNGFEVDFLLDNYKLIIEVDGYTHLCREKIKTDSYKDQKLNEAGYTIIHFTNQEVWEELAKCVKIVEEMHKANRIARQSSAINNLWKEELKKFKIEQNQIAPKNKTKVMKNSSSKRNNFEDIEQYFLSLDK